jgi:hypothetical protein
MGREEYINYRSGGSLEVIYQFYAEKYDNNKHKIFLSKNDLFPLLQNAGYDLREVMNECNIYFDNKYEVKKVYNKNNELIALI